MSDLRTVDDVIAKLPPVERLPKLEEPLYINQYTYLQEPISASSLNRIGLAVTSMREHTSNEGFQIFDGLRSAGYKIAGLAQEIDDNCVRCIVNDFEPDVVVIQDKREWEGKTVGAGFDDRERYRKVGSLVRPEIFRLTILKDAHQHPAYNRSASEEIGCHSWVVYYHPKIVCHFSPWIRPEHLIRTYHTVDSNLYGFSKDILAKKRDACMISGAVSDAYPLRSRIWKNIASIPGGYAYRHPGYKRTRCHTPEYLQELSKVKVSICTSSSYGYALRKLVESTACGCIPITDLPVDDVLPEIDEALVRVPVDTPIPDLASMVKSLYEKYDIDFRREMAIRAREFYDFRATGKRLADDIEKMRLSYNDA